jgi:hypothetical protein
VEILLIIILKSQELQMETMTLTMADVDEEKLGKLMAFLATQNFGLFTVSFETDQRQMELPYEKPLTKKQKLKQSPVEASRVSSLMKARDAMQKEFISKLKDMGAFEPELQSPEEADRMVNFVKVRELLKSLDVSTELVERLTESKAARAERLEKAKAPTIKRVED